MRPPLTPNPKTLKPQLYVNPKPHEADLESPVVPLYRFWGFRFPLYNNKNRMSLLEHVYWASKLYPEGVRLKPEPPK